MSLTINNESFTITNNGKSFEILKDNASLDRNSERVYMNGFWWDLEKATADGYVSLDDLYNTLRDKIDHRYASGGGGGIESIVAGTNITIDDTDPQNPIISATGGGSPAGSDTQIQYNNAGAFGADAGFTRDVATGNTLISTTYSGTDTYSDVISNNILGYGLTGSVKTWTGAGGNLAIQGIYEVSGFHVLANSLVISGKENGMVSKESGEVVLGNLSGGNNTKITIDDVNEHITISNLPAYDDDTAAGVGGLTAGMVYMTTGSGSAPLNAAGILMIKQ